MVEKNRQTAASWSRRFESDIPTPLDERNEIKGKKSLFTFTAVRKRNFVSFLLTTAVVVWGKNDQHDAICLPDPSLSVHSSYPSIKYTTVYKLL